jgi:hypothetical protein
VASNLRKNHDYNTQGSWNKINWPKKVNLQVG